MPLYELYQDRFEVISRDRYREAGVRERGDLQRLLCRQIEAIDANLMVLAEEFGDWEDSRRRIDILAIDRDANLSSCYHSL